MACGNQETLKKNGQRLKAKKSNSMHSLLYWFSLHISSSKQYNAGNFGFDRRAKKQFLYASGMLDGCIACTIQPAQARVK
jgi:hypothetical protein